MSEHDVLLVEEAREFLDVADEKTERICTEKLGFLAANPYPGRGRGDKEKLPSDARCDRFRMHISRTYRCTSRPTTYTSSVSPFEARTERDCPDSQEHHGTGDVGTARTDLGGVPVGWWVLGRIELRGDSRRCFDRHD